MSGSLQVAAAPFLNTEPLVYGLAQGLGEGRFELHRVAPAESARLLHLGEVDLGLVPVASLAQDGPWEVVPELGVAALGRVGSVVLVGQTPMERWTRVLLDEASRSSATLARLLLGTRGVHLPTEWASAEQVARSVGGDTGGLLIGDAAMDLAGRFAHRYDLGAAWWDLTGLPFVFAVWASRPGVLDDGDRALLEESLRFGLAARPLLARRWAEERGADPGEVLRYLEERIRYRLGPAEEKGMRAFLRRAEQAGLLPRTRLRLAPMTKGPVPCREHAQRTFGPGLEELLDRGARGERLGREELLALAHRVPPGELMLAADLRRRSLHPDGVVTYIVSRNVNYTNVCTTACAFCAFYRPRRHPEAYLLDREALGQRIQATLDAGGIEILLQGGLHPELDLAWYEDLFRWIKERFPIHLHALSPEEVWHICARSGLGLDTVMDRLVAAGLDSIPGGGAEILDDEVRRRIAPLKCSTDQWLAVMRAAHERGLPTTATMMFGVGEGPEQRVDHLLRIRSLQDETGGFTAFVAWPFQHQNTRLEPGDTSAVAYLRLLALARLALDNVPNLQASWVTVGPGVAQASLHGGANDFGQVMMEEQVVSAAGTTHRMDARAIERHIRDAGFRPMRRDARYRRLSPCSEARHQELDMEHLRRAWMEPSPAGGDQSPSRRMV